MSSILLVDDDADLLRLLAMRLTAADYEVIAVGSAEEALARLAIERPQLVLSDVRLPDMDGLTLFDRIHHMHPTLPVILLTAHGTIPDAVEATARGVYSYLTKPFDGKHLLEKIAQALELTPSIGASSLDSGPDERWRADIISHSARMADVLTEACLVAASDASVLIQGESGTGKEMLAQAIHRASPRADRAFIAVNCGAIPEALLESELFGHVKGAFTGAVKDHDGLLRAAEGGTVFLDEIGDMPLPLQVKLLRVLQERQVRPVGSSTSFDIDVRIISATHRNLDEAMAEGSFREDLYYRLNVVTLNLPTLMERREDIPLLAHHFLKRLSEKYGKPLGSFAPEAMRLLVTAAWPGNIRQLYNVVEQVCALTTTPLIPIALVQKALRVPSLQVLSYNDAKAHFERDYLISLLKLTDGSVSDAARLAERNRTEFYRLLQKHSLTPGLFRSANDVAD